MYIKNFNWKLVTPENTVSAFVDRYPNERSRASMLSLFKRKLRDSANPPPDEYLNELMLPTDLYQRINEDYKIQKNIDGHDVPVIENVNEAIEWALDHLDSNKASELWPAVILTSGFRPVEILSSSFIPYDGPPIVHDDFYIMTYDLAKKRGDGGAVIRPHPLLVNAAKWLDAVDKLRSILNIDGSRHDISQRYGRTWLRWLRKAYPMIPDVNHILLRRIYASYAYLCYKGDYEGVIDKITFIKDVLGHNSLGTSAIYNQIELVLDDLIDIFSE